MGKFTRGQGTKQAAHPGGFFVPQVGAALRADLARSPQGEPVGLTGPGQPRLSEAAQPYPRQLGQHAVLTLPQRGRDTVTPLPDPATSNLYRRLRL